MNRLTPAEQAVVAANLKLVPFALRGYHPPPGHDFDDLLAVGTLGLIGAAQRFDPDRGFQFSTYAVRCIRNEVANHLRYLNRQSRGGTGAKAGYVHLAIDTSLDGLLEVGYDHPSPDDPTADVDVELVLERLMAEAARIDKRLPSIILDRVNGASLQKAGNRHGLTNERVRQLLLVARSVLRDHIDEAAGVAA